MSEQPAVTVIGLGLMGSSLARVFARAGYTVTAWNRTPEKAAPLADCARIADSVEAACAASKVVVVSVRDYAASEALLHGTAVQEALSGKLLVQLTTGTPADARGAATWAQQHGVTYLDGAIMTYPSGIGSEQAVVLYAGLRTAFDDNVDLLRVLSGKPTYCGADPGAAAALDLALVGLWFGATAAVMHGAALCAAEATALADHSDLLRDFIGTAAFFGLRAQTAAKSGGYPSGNSTMLTNATAVRHILRASEDAGIDTTFPTWLLNCFTKAIERGHGSDDIESLYEAFRER